MEVITSESSLLGVLRRNPYWSREPAESISREIVPLCPIQAELVTVIQGVRRCGKSTLLRQLIVKHKIPTQKAVLINFEDPRLSNYLDHTLLEQIKNLSEQTLGDQLTFFLDEIQNISQWEKWIHTQLECNHKQHRYIITGSNSRLLSGELATALTGRHISIELFPFGLREYRRGAGSHNLKAYLEHGGFPGVLAFPEPEKLLQQYFHDIIERDVRERVAARSSHSLKALVQIVFESTGSELSLRRLSGMLGVSPDTVKLYIQACEDAYLIFSCPYFAYSEAKRTRRNKKYYAIDTALRRAVASKTGSDWGKDFENLVYLMLRQKTKEVYYWKDKGGVDFVVNTKNGPTPIQVTYKEPHERHEQALQAFYESFPHANEALFIHAENVETVVDIDF